MTSVVTKKSTLLLFVEVARYQGSNKGFSYTGFSASRAENKSGVNRVLFILILIKIIIIKVIKLFTWFVSSIFA